MIKRSTFSDLLSYAYNETGLADSDRIQKSIDGDPLVQEEYNELTETIKILDDVTPEINPAVIENILKFC
jgi:hypothetical protein